MLQINMRARVDLPTFKARAGECFLCDPASAAALKYQHLAEPADAPPTEERFSAREETDEPRRGRYRRRDMRAE